MGDMADDLYDALEREAFFEGQRTAEMGALSLSDFVAWMRSWNEEIRHPVIASMLGYWERTGSLTDKQRRYATSIMAEASFD